MSSEQPAIGNLELTRGMLLTRIPTDRAVMPDEDRGIADSWRVFSVSRPSTCLKLLEQFDDGALAGRSHFALLRLEQD
ncbi:hypothetical protein [Arthrobacter bambusae]|uniref:hypothetical protein n=1 Tax=Arthrobacter bambusae TaxID=1338426 RepID=UPI0027829B4D|nr:hypothetical protein [Arthrobacter bambusae]MDQ0212889.1 hypothetical protein [Arthrobacter bambusae]MDQ0237195.1 hypothetical protein [Arthrobacter bambusae]